MTSTWTAWEKDVSICSPLHLRNALLWISWPRRSRLMISQIAIPPLPIGRLRPYLIAQVGFSTDEPVEKEYCFYGEPTNGSVKM
ncbi:hypothetical protein PBY51_015655 [Eleginops maclovinus]|uniref:Uncharacterized protein n=1 Tax=Eleginops maclovinus TaxID=56733 RepID=A0AAN7XLQ5_ELEMC|nr:hypothetical protein PBY51_015655 [Eleginops maclovinus]